jgi:hypothetical protein
MNAMLFVMSNNPMRIEKGILSFFKGHTMFLLIYEIFLFVPLKRTFLHEKYYSNFAILPYKLVDKNMYDSNVGKPQDLVGGESRRKSKNLQKKRGDCITFKAIGCPL